MILFWLTVGVLAATLAMFAYNALMLRRILLLDRLLTEIVGQSFGAQLKGMPVWEPWLQSMGEMEVRVRAGRYQWGATVTSRRSAEDDR